jgi:hypothetical protein
VLAGAGLDAAGGDATLVEDPPLVEVEARLVGPATPPGVAGPTPTPAVGVETGAAALAGGAMTVREGSVLVGGGVEAGRRLCARAELLKGLVVATGRLGWTTLGTGVARAGLSAAEEERPRPASEKRSLKSTGRRKDGRSSVLVGGGEAGDWVRTVDR